MRIRPPRQTTLARLNSAIGLANQANSYRKLAKTWWVDRNTYSISITAHERFYIDVRQWLTVLIPQVSQRSVSLITVNQTGDLAMIHDSDKEQSFVLNGHKINVSVIKPPMSFSEMMEARSGSSLNTDSNSAKEEQVVFTCYNLEGQKALLAELQNLQKTNRSKAKVAQIHTFGRWGDWTNYVALPKRSLESVVLADGQTERIVNDIDMFLEAEEDYTSRGIPWHRGYLFSGPPGTGKSSLAKVLASHFNVDLWYLPLGSVRTDHSLMQVINSVGPRSILLLEDVDVFSSMRERDDEGENFTMSGLLNTLDGVATPHGLITILTTNDESKLDPAIKRPGRVDLHEKLGLLEKGQAERMFTVFYGQPPTGELELEGKAPASLMEIFKRNMHNPNAAEAECFAGNVADWTEDDEEREALRTQGGEDSDIDLSSVEAAIAQGIARISHPASGVRPRRSSDG